jgi:hypothetical protein
MKKKEPRDTIDVASLPLEDGRKVVVPLQALVEVQQIQAAMEGEGAPGELSWRGLDLPIESLDEVCGLPAPPRERMSTLGVFRADKTSGQPFRALAFCGSAAHMRIDAMGMTAEEVSGDGAFIGATRIQEEVHLIPNLAEALFSVH